MGPGLETIGVLGNEVQMISYVSTRGGISPVAFDEAVLSGFAADGGLFVPQTIPEISTAQLQAWSALSFVDLAFELLSLFIPRSIIPAADLKKLIDDSYRTFEHPDVVGMVPLDEQGNVFVMELFHGPTLSFKDVAMGFLINVLDYLLKKRNERLTIVLATIFPRGMITEEQERQMTTLNADNVHPVGVENCKDGGDDLDFVVARLFKDQELKEKLKLSSVNSINWCRVMVQSVHYFYGYFRAVEKVGDEIVFSVPSGAFGNLFGGYLARSMGLPVKQFICANNINQTLHTVLSTGVFARKDLVQTISSAIDIVVPYNFWRYLYFCTGGDSKKLIAWMDEFEETGQVQFDPVTLATIQHGYLSMAATDTQTKATIKDTFEQNGYLLDPHTSVAVVAANSFKASLPNQTKIVCLATAHPAKFPGIMRSCLDTGMELPEQGKHASLDKASKVCQHLRLCDIENLEFALCDAMTENIQKLEN